MVPKQTIGCFHESIGCFGFDSSTIWILKTPKYKTIGCFDKTIDCFSLSLKNTFLLKRLRMPILWIQSMSGLQYSIYPISYLRQLSNSKHSLAFNILQRVWILQSLNTIWFNKWLLSRHCMEESAGHLYVGFRMVRVC